MKVTFYSNFLTHHQLPFCLEMKKRLGNNFKFVSTIKIFQWRLDLGFEDLDKKYDFVIRAYENDNEYKKAEQLALESDIVIIGSIDDDLIIKRLEQDRITFRYRSRVFIFPDGVFKTIFNKEKIKLFYERHLKYRKNKNLYMLCANAYGPRDFKKLGLYKNRIYRWGYFIQNNYYNIEELINNKQNKKKVEIIWVARIIKWKHPEVVLRLARDLKKENLEFTIKIIGTGKLINKIKKKIKENNLIDVIEVVGQVPSKKVKEYMENADIFIGTSGSQEGWGVVINEAMNAGCAVVANIRMGAAPILINEGETGYIYNRYPELKEKVKFLIKNSKERRKVGKNAYLYITQKWTSSIAANNIIKLFSSILEGKECEIKDGPASKQN